MSPDNEPDFIDYLLVIWKHRWLVGVVTLIAVAIAAFYSFLTPRKWEVSAIITPSNFWVQKADEKLEVINFFAPKQIANQIDEGSYDSRIADELRLDIKAMPRIKAEYVKDTDLVRIFIKSTDAEQAKRILASLIVYLRTEMDIKAEIEIKNFDSQLQARDIERRRYEEDIKTLEKKLGIVRSQRIDVQKEFDSTKARIAKLEEERRAGFSSRSTSEADSLEKLLYSNAIAQSLQSQATYQEILIGAQLDEEAIRLKIEESRQKGLQNANEVLSLNQRKRDFINHVQVIKEPQASVAPVSLSKHLIIAAGGLLGLFLAVLLAFFTESIQKSKARLAA